MLRHGMVLLGWLLLAALAPASGAAEPEDAHVAVGHLRGIINPVAASYVERALTTAEAEGAQAFVLQLDTPGGLDTSMRQIVQRILASSVPVVVYVAPPGARAGSAGVYITYSAHLAAMAPNTNIGSATPVAIGEGGEARLSEEMRNKVTNDAVAYIKSLATARGRNADWAEQAVRQAVNATEQEALELGVINYIAADLPDLLRQIDGARVVTTRGEVVLRTAALPVRRLDMQPLEAFLHAITDPTIAYLLLTIGSLALVYELSNPGAIMPGVVGGIFLLLALYALGTLPVNLAGLLLIGFAMVLLLFDLAAPTHGVLTAGAIVSFLLGSAILINAPEGAPFLRIAPPAIALMTLVLTVFFGFVVGSVLRSHQRRSVMGREGLIGRRAEVREALDPEGLVFVDGELWTARTEGEPLPKGSLVEIVGVDGLRLRVRPVVATAGGPPSQETR